MSPPQRPAHALRLFAGLALGATLAARFAAATETENNVLRILPAAGRVVVDGKFEDWDLSGGVFGCGDVERFREEYAVWFHAMYDADHAYFLARWIDPTPLDNDQSSKGGRGFSGDCLQVRFISGYKTPQEVITWLTCWRDRDGVSVVDRVSPSARDANRAGVRLTNFANAIDHGARQGFGAAAGGRGYVQELAIPWAMLTADGKAPPAGSEVRIAIEPNFTAGPGGRVSIKDLFREGVVVDRVFTFRAYDHWGTGALEKSGHAAQRPLRLADGREFAVRLENGRPAVDWTGLFQQRELPGFKRIAFDLPADGLVSLHLRNQDGRVVRQMLGARPYAKGRHEVKWDGLSTPIWRTPGDPLPAGDYTWEAIAHPGLQVTLRGWAVNGGTPWQSGATNGWGGDHGVPAACATDGEKIYLGWNGAEAGRAVIACDLEGNLRWKIGGGLGESCEHMAVEAGTVYTLNWFNSVHGRELVRLRAADGVFDNWEGRPNAAVEIPELWEGRDDAAAMPGQAEGLDVKNGTLYLTFSSPLFRATDVTDWKALVARLLQGGPVADPVLNGLTAAARKRLASFADGKLTETQALQSGPRDRLDHEILRKLNGQLAATNLAPETRAGSPAARALANRRFIEQQCAPLLRPLKTGYLAACDAKTAKLRTLVEVPFPTAVRAVDDRLVYVISEGTTVLAVNPRTGDSKPLVTGLQNAANLAVDAKGRLLVGVGAPDHQVKIFSSAGKPDGTVGRAGGRPRLGPWQPDGLYAIQSLVVDPRQRIWVMEGDRTPKRVSVWDPAGARLVKEFFGPTHYGASGGAICPVDPDVMLGEGCEWRLDPATGRARCAGVFDNALHEFAVFCTPRPAGGSRESLYVATVQRVDTVDSEGRGVRIFPTRIFQRLAEGDYRLRAAITPDRDGGATHFWSDANDNQRADEGETTSVPQRLTLYGSNGWSLNLNPRDLTLYAVSAGQSNVFQIAVAGWTACGAPRWDVAGMKPLPFAWCKEVVGMLPDAENRLLVTCGAQTYFRCFEIATGRELWAYPNPFFQVHGSHKAPPPEPGLFRGAYGLVGTFVAPGLGTVWGINGNCGEWYLLTERGHYLGRLFQGDVMKQKFPAAALPGADLTEAPPGSGGEDFGGMLTQGRDGRVYVQTGKTAVWNTELTGFAAVKTIGSGTISLAPGDLALARQEHDRQMQTASGTKLGEIRRASPQFTGNPGKDFAGIAPWAYQKQDDAAVRTYAAWDDANLYLAWDVLDHTPWINGATEPAQMYLSGDTVDFQFGADPRAKAGRTEAAGGDLRVSIGAGRGGPAAVLYRPVSPVKKPRAFTSGVIAHYEMEFVDALPGASVTNRLRPDRKGYIVEAAIPWGALGFTPAPDVKYRGDFGVTHGDAAGARTRLRTHWNNQETGLVDDAVFELKLAPRNWGELVFRR